MLIDDRPLGKLYTISPSLRQRASDAVEPTSPPAANRFVELVSAGRTGTFYRLQTADDIRLPGDTKRSDRDLARSINGGTLEQHATKLADLQRRGAAVWISLNTTAPYQPRSKSNIIDHRVVSADIDAYVTRADLKTALATCIPPTVAVQTSQDSTNPERHRWQLHWACKYDLGTELWAAAMAGIHAAFAALGADASAIDNPASVWRLPGYRHLKARPFEVTIIDDLTSGALYSPHQLVEAFSAAPATAVSTTVKAKPRDTSRWSRKTEAWDGKEPSRDLLKRRLHAIDQYLANHGPKLITTPDQRRPFELDNRSHQGWLHIGMALHHFSRGEVWGLNLWIAWSRGGRVTLSTGEVLDFKGAPENYDAANQERTWWSFGGSSDGITGATIGWLADQHCGHKGRGRPVKWSSIRPKSQAPTPEVLAVREAATHALEHKWGLPDFVEGHAIAFEKHFGSSRRPLRVGLMQELVDRLDFKTAIGKMPERAELAQALGCSEQSLKDPLKDITKAGFLVRSSSREIGHHGYKVGSYALAMPVAMSAVHTSNDPCGTPPHLSVANGVTPQLLYQWRGKPTKGKEDRRGAQGGGSPKGHLEPSYLGGLLQVRNSDDRQAKLTSFESPSPTGTTVDHDRASPTQETNTKPAQSAPAEQPIRCLQIPADERRDVLYAANSSELLPAVAVVAARGLEYNVGALISPCGTEVDPALIAMYRASFNAWRAHNRLAGDKKGRKNAKAGDIGPGEARTRLLALIGDFQNDAKYSELGRLLHDILEQSQPTARLWSFDGYLRKMVVARLAYIQACINIKDDPRWNDVDTRWRAGKNFELEPSDMTDEHLKNAVAMLDRLLANPRKVKSHHSIAAKSTFYRHNLELRALLMLEIIDEKPRKRSPRKSQRGGRTS